MVILSKIYYNLLQAKVKINNCLSKVFKLKNGVKQGGVLSGDCYTLKSALKSPTLPNWATRSPNTYSDDF